MAFRSDALMETWMAGEGGVAGGGAFDAEAEAALDAGQRFIDQAARLAARDPAQAIALISDLVAKAKTIADYAEIRVASGAGLVAPAAVSGEGRSGSSGLAVAGGDADDLGRNQRSRIREVVVLEILQRQGAPCALSALMSGLASRGFSDSQAAVVSHLHRLKSNGLIAQPGNGFYDITSEGHGHLRRLKASLGSLVGG